MSKNPTFTTKELVAFTGIDANVLRGLLNGRWITADIRSGVGRGRSLLFSYKNLVEVALAKRLHHFNASSRDIGAILQHLRAYYEPAPEDASLDWKVAKTMWEVTRGLDAPEEVLLYWSGDRDEIELAVRDFGAVPDWDAGHVCINLTRIVADLHSATGRLWPPPEVTAKDAARQVAHLRTLRPAAINSEARARLDSEIARWELLAGLDGDDGQ